MLVINSELLYFDNRVSVKSMRNATGACGYRIPLKLRLIALQLIYSMKQHITTMKPAQ